MFNRFTLRFKLELLEEEYRNSLNQMIKIEMSQFRVQFALLSCINLLGFAISDEYLQCVFSVGLLLLVEILLTIAKAYPIQADWILSLLQLILGILVNIYPRLFDSNQDQISVRFPFFRMFQLYCHVFLLNLGIYYCYQLLPIVITFAWALAENPPGSNLSLLTYFQILILTVILVYHRRHREKNRRIAFLNQKENHQWYQIVDKIIKKKLLLVRFDKPSDQLKLERLSKTLGQHFSLKTQKDFRSFLRQIKIVTREAATPDKLNLESMLREHILQTNLEISYRMIELKDQLYYEYYGVDSKHGKQYKIRVIHYFSSNQRMLIVIFKSLGKTVKQSNPAHQTLIYLCCQQLMAIAFRSSQLLLSILGENSHLVENLLFDHCFLSFTKIWLNSAKVLSTRNVQVVAISEFLIELKQRFHVLKDDPKTEEFTITTSKYSMQIILIMLIKFIQVSTQSKKIELKANLVEKKGVRYLKVIFAFEPARMQEVILTFLRGRQQFTRSNDLTGIGLNSRDQISKINDHFQTLYIQLQGQDRLYISLGLVIVKYLLSNYGVNNKIKIKRGQLNLKILDLKVLNQKHAY